MELEREVNYTNNNNSEMDEIAAIKEENHTVQFESASYIISLLSGLNNMRNKNLLVDVKLIAGGKSFDAHRVVLASCSDYFRIMFTSEVLESRQKEVRLEGVSANGMLYLLEYAYTSRLSLNLANIQDVLSAANHLQIITIVEACSNYLQAQLDLENCVDIATLAETYSLNPLRKRVYRFISDHLMEFSQTLEFQRLSACQLEYLLDSNYPVDCCEGDLLQIVLQWIDYSYSERISFTSKLLGKINYEEIPSQLLKMIWDHHLAHPNSSFPYVKTCCSTYDRIERHMLGSSNSYPMSLPKVPSLINSRGMELAIIKVGGFGITGVTNEVTYYLPSIGKWHRLTTIPHVESSNFGTAVLDNQLYVIGGCFNQCLQENIHPFGFSFNPRFNKWSTMAPMLTERCRFTLNVVEDKLYAVGGASETTDEFDITTDGPCESYDPIQDNWHAIAPLPIPRTQHAGASWKKFLFISGGLEHDVVVSSLMRYNTHSNKWEMKAPMLSPRADHAMLVYKDKLLVCGGWCEDEVLGNRILVTTIDEFDLVEGRWRVLTQIPTPRYHSGMTLVNSKLFIIGGFHSDVTFDRTTGVIECFDLETNEWSTVERYPQDIWEHVCATLYIPKCREDMEVMSDLHKNLN